MLRDRIIGPQQLVGPQKARRVKKGKYVGGIEFERSPLPNPVAKSQRCYSLSLVTQAQRRMSAPSSGSKLESIPPCVHTDLRSDILKHASVATMDGLARGPPDLVETLQEQADFVNLPHVGSDSNVAHPSFQLNVATAVEPDENKDELESLAIGSLGKFGKPHIDGADSPAAPSSMTVLSSEYKEIEQDLFYVLDFGIAWTLDPISIYYFSGLHFHGGSQPVYKQDRTDKSFIFYRLTLIGYPPDDMLSGKEALAFATMPTGEPLRLGFEYRDR
jgi:hypothetical protein